MKRRDLLAHLAKQRLQSCAGGRHSLLVGEPGFRKALGYFGLT
jgi:hypothetical protein